MKTLTILALVGVMGFALGSSPAHHVEKQARYENDLKKARAYNRKLEHVVRAQVNRAERNERKLRRANRAIRRLDRIARVGYDYPKLIHLAAIAYRYPRSTLERRARCESVNFTDFYNETPIYNGEHAQGVFGFIPSTFASTPYRDFDILDPFANILAGAWMHAVAGREREWACR